jgi:hypothetical protein
MRIRPILAGLLAVGLAACQPQADEAPAPSSETAAADAVFAPQTAGTHTITGVLYDVRGEFPSYAIMVGPADGDPASMVQINALATEAGGAVEPEAMNALVTQPVTVRYSSQDSFGMVDILVNGASVLVASEGNTTSPDDLRTLEGVLSGAEGESGDLPSSLTVTGSDGTSVTFDAFIEPGMARANGQTVTLKYVAIPDLQLLSIAPAG